MMNNSASHSTAEVSQDERYNYGSTHSKNFAHKDADLESIPRDTNDTKCADHRQNLQQKASCLSDSLTDKTENSSSLSISAAPHKTMTREPDDGIKSKDAEAFRNYSLVTRSRILTQIVAMMYFAGFLCTNSLLPQYMVHRLTKDTHGLLNASQQVTSSSPCNTSNSSSSMEADAIQSKASQQVLYFTLSASIPSLVTCLIAGGYSDFFGRRPLLLTGCFTGSLKMLLITIIIKLELPTWLFYVAYAADGLSGSWTIMFVMFVSSIADTNPEKKDRAFWVAILGFAISLVGALLLVVTGVLIDQLGFFAASFMCVVSSTLAFLLAFFFFPETFPPPKDKKLKLLDGVRKISSYFFHGGSSTERLKLWTCLFIFMLTVLAPLCLVTIDTLYLLHRPFCWTHSAIGIYSGARMAATFFTGTIILRTFQNCCKPEVLAMVGLLFQTAGFLLEAESSKFWHVLLVPVVSCPSTISIPVIRAILSSLGSSADQGAINSSVAVVEVVINLVGNVGVLSIYSATLAGPLPGAVYLFLASCGVAAFLLYLLYFKLRKLDKEYEQLIN